MATAMDRGIDLNLSCSPCSSDGNNNNSEKEEIRQAIIHHEFIFRDQVRELHRLYWTQKHMMHELLWRESNLLNTQHRSLPVPVPAREMQWNFGSDIGGCQFDVGEGSGVSKKLSNVVIDLEKPINLDSDEEDEVICLSDSPAPGNGGKDKVGRFWDGSDDTSLHDDLNLRASMRFDFEVSAQEHNTSIRLPPDKEETTSERPFQIDLNISQDEEPQNDVTTSCLLDTGNLYQKQSDSVNGSSKGSSITLLANITTISAKATLKEPSCSDEGRQEKDPDVVKEKNVINLNISVGSTDLLRTASPPDCAKGVFHATDVIGSEDDTVSSHVLTTNSDIEIHTGDSAQETDINVAAAAETLLSFQSEKCKSFVYEETIGNFEECTSEDDSFVIATLGLQEETADDATWIPPNNLNIGSNAGGNGNGNAKPMRTINLRRGRGLRDFQRDVLPGMISLSRLEICEDLQIIGYEVRKTRSRKNFDPDEWTRPVRGRKSRRRGGRR